MSLSGQRSSALAAELVITAVCTAALGTEYLSLCCWSSRSRNNRSCCHWLCLLSKNVLLHLLQAIQFCILCCNLFLLSLHLLQICFNRNDRSISTRPLLIHGCADLLIQSLALGFQRIDMRLDSCGFHKIVCLYIDCCNTLRKGFL